VWLLLAIGVLASPLFAQVPDAVSIAVQETPLRERPSFLGSIIAELSYGDRVEVLESSGAWLRVRLEGAEQEGWIAEAAASEERIVLDAGDADAQAEATDDEIALAGRGFSEQVEAEFREQQDLDFSAIDELEAKEVPPETISAFLQEAGLGLPEGGSR
jgi:hypothetical protein